MRRKMTQTGTLAVVLIGLVAAWDLQEAMGQTSNWVSPLSGSWSQPASWSPFGVPDGPSVNVVVDSNSNPVTVTLNTSRTVGTLHS